MPAGTIQLVEAKLELLASLNAVKVAEPETTVNPANEPVTDVVDTTPVALTGIFAMFIYLIILQYRLNTP